MDALHANQEPRSTAALPARWQILTVLILTTALLMALPVPAHAVSDQEVRLLMDRISRLEQQLGAVQSRVDRGGGTRTTASGAGGNIPPTIAAQLELRVSELESQLRAMNGRIEEMGFNMRQFQARLDTALSDMEYRISGNAPGSAPPPDRSAAATSSTAALPRRAPAPIASSTPIVGTASSGPAPAALEAATQERQTAALTGNLPEGTEEEQYRYATSFLRQAAYGEAESALRAFIDTHPDGPLTGNARYWLGETYYVRERYEDAVVAFAEGYQKHPRGPKAADNLLKLGMSLGNLGKKREACATFSQLRSKFPKASNFIKQTAATQRKRLSC